MKQPPSNAIEIPIQRLVFDDLTHCDGCDYYTAGQRFNYTFKGEGKPPTMLPTKVRKADIQLCRGCRIAYGRTLEVNGWKLQEKLF